MRHCTRIQLPRLTYCMVVRVALWDRCTAAHETGAWGQGSVFSVTYTAGNSDHLSTCDVNS